MVSAGQRTADRMPGRASGGRGWMVAVVLHAMLIQLLAGALRPSLAYGMLQTDGAAGFLGFLSATWAVPALILALPAGRFADRFGERTSALLGAGIVVLAALTALVGRGALSTLLLASLLLGAGHMFTVVSEQALVANRALPDRLDSTFGLYSLAASVGQSLGPLLLTLPGPTPAEPPIEVIFEVCVGLGIALGITSYFMGRSHRPAGDRPQAGIFRSTGTLLRLPGVLRALAAGSVAVSSVEVIQTYWPALGSERHLGAAVVGAMLVARAIASAASRSVLGFSVRRFGRRRLMIVSLSVSAVALACVAIPLPAVVLIVAAAVFGFAIGICQPLTMSWITAITPPGNRGMTMSLRLAGNRISQATIPVLFGALAAASGVAGVLVASGAALALSALIVRRGRMSIEPPEPDAAEPPPAGREPGELSPDDG